VCLTCAIISSIAIEQSATSIIDKSTQQRINEYVYQLALNAQKITKVLNLQKSLQEELFIAALMSSIGKLIVASRTWQDSFASQFTEWPVRKVIVAISAYLLTLWGYSESLCNTILSSAEPEVSNVEHNLALLLCLAHYATKYHSRIPDEILDKLPDEQIKLKLANL
jgi:HD-like signal output (HDOD) protein